MAGPCNCCEEPPCDAPGLDCESFVVIGEKCGVSALDATYDPDTDQCYKEGSFVTPVPCESIWRVYKSPGFQRTYTYPPCEFVDESITWTDPPELFDEDTAAAMIARAEADLAALTEPNGGDCGSERNLPDGESTMTLRRARVRIAHQHTGTCYLKVWLRTRFDPVAGGDDVLTDLTPYEWIGSGNPCLSDPTKAYNHPDNDITSDWMDVDPPEDNGIVTVELVKWSCVSGYEPDISDPENPQPNGFPDPEWELAPP